MQTQSTQQIFQQENAIFKKQINQQLKSYLKNQEIVSTLENVQWVIDEHLYLKQNWKQLFKQLIKCLANKIWLEKNQYPQLINQIQDIQFPNLKQIYLFQNNINNIESLSLMKCQTLQTISLSSNHIREIKCFKKLYLPSLSIIFLYDNPMSQISNLNKLKANQKKEANIWLQCQNDNDSKLIATQDLSIIMKLSFEKTYNLQLDYECRIRQPKIFDMFKQRLFTI